MDAGELDDAPAAAQNERDPAPRLSRSPQCTAASAETDNHLERNDEAVPRSARAALARGRGRPRPRAAAACGDLDPARMAEILRNGVDERDADGALADQRRVGLRIDARLADEARRLDRLLPIHPP